MARFITTLEAMGKDVAWMLLQQARGIPEAKGIDDYLVDRTFVVLFARADLSERLCITAAIRQMSGHVVYMGPEEHWQEAATQYQTSLLGAISYYMDGVITHGLQVGGWNPEKEVRFPVLNCGSVEAHPAHALADIACMLRHSREDLRKVRLAWIGIPSGAMFSLMTGTRFFGYSMSLGLPAGVNRAPIEARIRELKTDITIHDTAEEAVKGCRFVEAGSRGLMSFEDLRNWSLSADLLARAEDGVLFMSGTNPLRSIPLDVSLVEGKTSLVLLQAENRLRVYKRMLHWLFDL